jgi:hypothetical protein
MHLTVNQAGYMPYVGSNPYTLPFFAAAHFQKVIELDWLNPLES